jgi:isovaleryl-CoA dehydrogenase
MSSKNFISSEKIYFSTLYFCNNFNLSSKKISSRSFIKQIGKQLLPGIITPRRYNGLGKDLLHQAQVMRAISRLSPSLALSYIAHSNLCTMQIINFGSQQQKNSLLPSLASGKTIGALAITETEIGSDAKKIRLQAKPCPNGYLLNGSKCWITNANIADTIITYARHSENKKIYSFVVHNNRNGIKTTPISKIGMKNSDTGQVFLTDYFARDEDLLSTTKSSKDIMFSGLDNERLALAAGPIGIIEACFDVLLPYLFERKQFNTPLIQHPPIKDKFSELYSQYKTLLYSYYHILQYSKTDVSNIQSSAASILHSSTKTAMSIVLDCIQLLGANGYANNTRIACLLNDIKLYEIGGGTTEMRRYIIAKNSIHNWNHWGNL